MDHSERKTLLEKLDKDSITLGVSIPEEMDIQDQKIPLQEIVFEVSAEGEFPNEIDLTLQQFKQQLRQEQNECVESLRNQDLTYSEGEQKVQKVAQIERTLTILESSEDSQSLEEQISLSEAKDKKMEGFCRAD